LNARRVLIAEDSLTGRFPPDHRHPNQSVERDFGLAAPLRSAANPKRFIHHVGSTRLTMTRRFATVIRIDKRRLNGANHGPKRRGAQAC